MSSEEPAAFVEAWIKTTNAHDANALRAFYGDVVRFYGASLPRDACISKLQTYFSKHPTAAHTIGPVTIDAADAGVTRAAFTKTVVEKGAKHDYACHLDLARSGPRWIIVGESDTTTDANLAKAGCQDLEWTIYEMWTGASPQTEATLTGTIALAHRAVVDGGTRDYFRLGLDKPVCPDTRVKIPNYDGDTSVGRLGRITGYTPCGEVCGGPSFDAPASTVEVFKAAAFVGAKVRVTGTLHVIHDPPLGHDLLYVSAEGSAEKLVFADDSKIERL